MFFYVKNNVFFKLKNTLEKNQYLLKNSIFKKKKGQHLLALAFPIF